MSPHVVIRLYGVHLVGLLEVLVGPHIRGDGGREGVVSYQLCSLGCEGSSWDISLYPK